MKISHPHHTINYSTFHMTKSNQDMRQRTNLRRSHNSRLDDKTFNELNRKLEIRFKKKKKSCRKAGRVSTLIISPRARIIDISSREVKRNEKEAGSRNYRYYSRCSFRRDGRRRYPIELV